jgi:serine/threonine protein kinase
MEITLVHTVTLYIPICLIAFILQLTWSEMPNYQDFVIPKTELFYRSTIVETVDLSVEIHLWRRKLACVKRFKFDLLTRDNIKYFKDEANIFKKLSHENIVRFYGILIDPPSLGIVMQFCTNSDVFKQIEKMRQGARNEKASKEETLISVINPLSFRERDSSKEKDISSTVKNLAKHSRSLTIYEDHVVHSVSMEEELQVMNRSSDDDDIDEVSQPYGSHRFAMKMSVHRMSSVMSVRQYETKDTFEPMLVALQVARGMAYLHSQGITHRDMKSLNVLLDEKYNAQIADFGESSFGEISSTGDGPHLGEMGTPGWAAPELLLGEGVSKASDVFSFGIILWELLTLRAPSVLITLEMLQLPNVCGLPSTYNHPFLKIRKSNSDRTDKHSISSTSSGFSGFFDRMAQPGSTPSGSTVSSSLHLQDHDLTMIEIGDLQTAKVLMCDLRLRPPMPCNLPAALKNILTSCWSANESRRPSFSDIYTDLEKMLVNQEFDKLNIPCEVEAVVHICRDRSASSVSVGVSDVSASENNV